MRVMRPAASRTNGTVSPLLPVMPPAVTVSVLPATSRTEFKLPSPPMV